MMQQNIDVTNIILYNALREHLGKKLFSEWLIGAGYILLEVKPDFVILHCLAFNFFPWLLVCFVNFYYNLFRRTFLENHTGERVS